MRLGLGLSLTQPRGSASTPAPPVSLIDTGDLTATGTAGYQEILGPDSIRFARNAGGLGRYSVSTSALPPGTYRITFDAVAYDGAIVISNPSQPFFQLQDNFGALPSGNGVINGAGAKDLVITFNTQLMFVAAYSQFGARMNSIFVEAT